MKSTNMGREAPRILKKDRIAVGESGGNTFFGAHRLKR
jgi:hypothetical protein